MVILGGSSKCSQALEPDPVARKLNTHPILTLSPLKMQKKNVAYFSSALMYQDGIGTITLMRLTLACTRMKEQQQTMEEQSMYICTDLIKTVSASLWILLQLRTLSREILRLSKDKLATGSQTVKTKRSTLGQV